MPIKTQDLHGSVLKPKHSGFFSTTLDTLLEHLGVKTVILVGIAGRPLTVSNLTNFILHVPGE